MPVNNVSTNRIGDCNLTVALVWQLVKPLAASIPMLDFYEFVDIKSLPGSVAGKDVIETQCIVGKISLFSCHF